MGDVLRPSIFKGRIVFENNVIFLILDVKLASCEDVEKSYFLGRKYQTVFLFVCFVFCFFGVFLFVFLYCRFLLVINFIHISVYMSIPITQFITTPPNPPWLSPLGVHTFVLYTCVSISALQTGSSVPFF